MTILKVNFGHVSHVLCLFQHFQELEEEHICQMKDFVDTYARAMQNEHVLFGQVRLQHYFFILLVFNYFTRPNEIEFGCIGFIKRSMVVLVTVCA